MGTTHNTYQPLAWQALAELRDAVRKYGLGSVKVMQVLRYFYASLLTPFDIRSLAQTLFPPVEYDFFEHKWTQLAVRVVEWNTTLGPGDPRRMVNTNMLMGTGYYTRADGQAGFEPLVLEQCQQTGMAALVQTLQLATPQQSFVTVIQGVDEPFLPFAGRLTAAVEKQVAPEKVQQQSPWKYLGVKILERTIRHQDVQFVPSVKTLNDAQKLVYRIEPSIDVTVFITTPDLHPTSITGQWNDNWTDPLHVLEWVFLPHQVHETATALFELIARLIIKCRQHCLQLMDADPSKIILPLQREEFDWSYANNVSLQSALKGFSGQITYHLPSHKLLQVAKNTQFSLRPKNSQEPVPGSTVFTDSSGKTGKAIVTWQDGSEWQVLESHEDGSAQLVELKAAVMAFEKFSQEPFNLITDSAYVDDIAQRLGYSVLKEVSNPALFNLLKALWCAIQARVHPYYVLHVRSQTNLPGFVAEGNARADKLANPAWVAPQPDVLTQAKASHGVFHQNAHTLQKQFQLTATEAREIVELCDNCHTLGAPLPAGVNPRGLKALELWQTDVTQVAEFGWLKYLHVMVDTFSSAVWASAHTGEKARDVIAHWRQAFAVLDVSSAVKTDNGPAYASQQVRQFLQSWGVSHNFGIPHSLTGQAIVECCHCTLKRVLQKQKWGMQGETPHSRLAKALYTINHLMVPQNSNNPVILNHHLSLQASDSVQQPRVKVWVRNLVTKQWEGPCDLIAMGRGYACVSTDTGTRWLPSKCVRPDLRLQRQNSANRQGGSRDQLESHQVDESSSDHSNDSSTDSD
ncbi:hypothetical protein DUI87_30753 [Hirundo rustica rustica]|uniref:RNA-directed DNA polymerase n=1 Tax=Hirundo rustica rustica TaxID=333673 RepID=A0A3M0J234_HIRRU|nr:hypothetical protein DUI87_30753 [Hirundo rustica rustica]